MKIAIGNDHGGVEMKRHLVEYLTNKGYEVIDLGAQTTESCHYPVFGQRVGHAVVAGEADYTAVTVDPETGEILREAGPAPDPSTQG